MIRSPCTVRSPNSQEFGVWPSASSRLFIRPFVRPKNMSIISQMTTIDMKCGIYVIICTVFLKRARSISLSSSANTIDIGNVANEYSDMTAVLRIMFQKSG